MNKIFILLLVFFTYGCSNHREIKINSNNQVLMEHQALCYELDKSMLATRKIFSKSYLDKDRQSSNSYFEYSPIDLLKSIISVSSYCSHSKVKINDITIFDKYRSDTAQWKEWFFIAIDISYLDKKNRIRNIRFKDYDSTKWLYAFKFPDVNKIYIQTIQRALVRIFQDIEETITNKLTLEQRNAKKDPERLETERLMDKYIQASKALEKN